MGVGGGGGGDEDGEEGWGRLKNKNKITDIVLSSAKGMDKELGGGGGGSKKVRTWFFHRPFKQSRPQSDESGG